ncbi:Prenyltransferase and squalene oxidase repeat family protein [Histomonas meleagridis]|uniref:Prenyltransferase and squalene oxidase repeat family protein n=1 Tax=Histomonas meleagridis TaxID=135588 RepID=UPI003559F91D|nr:Prenyltransferase and squalene oxidase repeat family protein [Histomonas meleagridis]KAH0802929.1 Prenyltransferase and squalene oxidase repeat family protein [Histomonas meleagridis]
METNVSNEIYDPLSDKWRFDDEGVVTITSEKEIETENAIIEFKLKDLKLLRKKHIFWIRTIYKNKDHTGRKQETFGIWNPTYFIFVLRCLNLSNKNLLEHYLHQCRDYLKRRIANDGGFAGFKYDNSHLVTNYAALTAIALIGRKDAYQLVNRQKLYNLLLSLKLPNGAFRVSKGMEHDIRSTYSAILIAYMYNILTPELTHNVEQFVLSCQNYDGAFSPLPGCESHGGYVSCAVGIMSILGKLDLINMAALIRWISDRQMAFSGGFQGRPNKLVDSCYSWWIGSSCRIITEHLGINPFWNETAMTDYIIKSAQYLKGGFLDHRPSLPDPYHTMLALGGLCLCGLKKIPEEDENDPFEFPELSPLICCPKYLVNRLFNYFHAQPPIQSNL